MSELAYNNHGNYIHIKQFEKPIYKSKIVIAASKTVSNTTKVWAAVVPGNANLDYWK